MWGCAGDSKFEAQFAFGHPGAAFWSCTRLEIKVQFGPGYLGAVQKYIKIILCNFSHIIKNIKKNKL